MGVRYGLPFSARPGTKYGLPLAAPIYKVTLENPIIEQNRQWTRAECIDRLDILKKVEKQLEKVNEKEILREEINNLERLLNFPETSWQ